MEILKKAGEEPSGAAEFKVVRLNVTPLGISDRKIIS
jgi:hypothetical protein